MAITKDAVSNKDTVGTPATSLTWSHTVTSSQSNLILIVAVDCFSNTISGVTYSGASLTQLGSTVSSGDSTFLSFWYKLAPATGANNIVVSSSASASMICAAISYYNVAQSSTFGTVATHTGTTTTSSTNVTTTASTQLVLDIVNTGQSAAPSPTASQTTETSDSDATILEWVGLADKAATGSTMTMTWSGLSSTGWGEFIVAMSAAPTATNDDIVTRFRLAILKNISTRFRLAGNKDVTTRFRLGVLKDITTRFRLAVLKDITTRFRLRSANILKDVTTRFRLAVLKDIITRFRLGVLKDVTTRFRLGVLKDITTRLFLASPPILKDIATRFRLRASRAILTVGGVGYPFIEDTVRLRLKVDERQRMQVTVIDYLGVYSFTYGSRVILTDPIRGVMYAGYLIDDKQKRDKAYQNQPNTYMEHELDCTDGRYLWDKRTGNRLYTSPIQASRAVMDMLADSMTAEGVVAPYASVESTTIADWGTGTLVGTQASDDVGDGDLELTNAGTDITITESVTADFARGTLTNTVASTNSLHPVTISALMMQTTLGTAIYGKWETERVDATFWTGSFTVANPDTLFFDIWIPATGPVNVGIDLFFNDGTQLTGTFPVTDLSAVATRLTWYTKQISLTSLAGKTITSVSFYNANSAVGTFSYLVKNCYLGSQSSSPFFGTSASSPVVSPPTVIATGEYIAATTSVTVVAVYPAVSSRISAGYPIGNVGLVQNSRITWIASLPTTGPSGQALPASPPGGTNPVTGAITPAATVQVFVSYDGVVWFPCVLGQPLPALAAGTDVTGLSLSLKEQFTMGQDPTAVPALDEVTVTLFSAAGQVGTEVISVYSNATQWNTGTFAGTEVNGNGDLTVGASSTFSQNWNSNTITGQSWFPQPAPPTLTQSAATGAYVITCGAGTQWTSTGAISRFDFAGVAQDVTIECDLTISAVTNIGSGPFLGFITALLFYRTSNASIGGNQTNYFQGGYFVGLLNGTAGAPATESASATQSSFVVLGFGGIGGSSPPAFTIISSVAETLTPGTAYHIKVVATGSTHTVYFNHAGSPTINVTDTSYVGPGSIGVASNFSSAATATATYDNFTVTAAQTTGTWTSAPIALTSLGTTCGATQIYWTENDSNGVPQATASVLASLNNGVTWATCTNGASIPILPFGTVLGSPLLLQIVLGQSVSATTPVIHYFYARICSGYPPVTGLRSTVPLALDSFSRANVASGWGIGTDLQRYTQTGTGTTALTSNEGTITNTTGDVHMSYGTIIGKDEEGVCRFSLSASTISAGLELRYNSTSYFYRLSCSTTAISIIRVSAGTQTTLTTASVTLLPNTYYRLRYRVTGQFPVSHFGRVWADTTVEPTTWNVTTTDY